MFISITFEDPRVRFKPAHATWTNVSDTLTAVRTTHSFGICAKVKGTNTTKCFTFQFDSSGASI